MAPFDFHHRTRVIFGEGALERLGELAHELGFRKTLLVADPGLVGSGHVDEAINPLTKAGIQVFPFHDFEPNPDSTMVERGRAFAASVEVDSVIGLGGGSSMDCAKAINFLLTNGGKIQDYWGFGKASRALLPMIGIPTTGGTGSEAQSYALISDSGTHVKMACGDPKAAFRVAILDPRLAVSQPFSVRAATGLDALSHAVETYVSTKRNPISECFSREAWRLLDAHLERVLAQPDDLEALGAMLLGAHFAGVAIESSMLGATHACANPLTARYGATHGVAVALLLPHVVRWNEPVAAARYRELAGNLAGRLEDMLQAARFPRSLSEIGVLPDDLRSLADEAGQQWTGRFNPRPFDASGALEIYQCAF